MIGSITVYQDLEISIPIDDIQDNLGDEDILRMVAERKLDTHAWILIDSLIKIQSFMITPFDQQRLKKFVSEL